ncbi:metallophosphoesterase family protein [Pradoshia sp.]
MKLAIISDIHGNNYALQRILEDAQSQQVDGYILAGDYCISAPWPKEVVDTIMSLPNAYVVCGNEEHYLHIPDGDDGQMEISRWCQKQLSQEQKAWLDSLPVRRDFEIDNVSIHVSHASSEFIGRCEYKFGKTSHLHMLYGEDYVSHEQNLGYAREQLLKDDEFISIAESLPEGVYIFGHSHNQWHLDYKGRIFINPGSAGLPLDCISFGFPYTIIELDNGKVRVEERRIPCEPEVLIAEAKKTDQFKNAHVWSEIIFHEWRTSREMIIFFLNNAEEYADSIGDSRRPFAKDTWEAAYLDWKSKISNPGFNLMDDGVASK